MSSLREEVRHGGLKGPAGNRATKRRSEDQNGDNAMFSNLDEQIESTVGASPGRSERVLRFLLVAAVSIVVFGGLFVGVWLLEF